MSPFQKVMLAGREIFVTNKGNWGFLWTKWLFRSIKRLGKGEKATAYNNWLFLISSHFFGIWVLATIWLKREMVRVKSIQLFKVGGCFLRIYFYVCDGLSNWSGRLIGLVVIFFIFMCKPCYECRALFYNLQLHLARHSWNGVGHGLYSSFIKSWKNYIEIHWKK